MRWFLEEDDGEADSAKSEIMENNDACGSYLGHPRVGVSTADPFFKAPPLQIGFSLVLLKKTDDECGGMVCRSTTVCGAMS